MSQPSHDPELVTLEPQRVAVLRETVRMDALPDFFARAYQAVMEAAGNQGARIIGPPVGIYYSMPTDSVDVAAGFPVDRPVSGDGLRTETLPGGPAAQVMHVGSYDTMQATYGRLMVWLQEQGLVPTTTMWESYLTEPNADAPETMLTQITWPVVAPGGE
ncbi:effector-binding domain-containing protein [Raineyella antarctica]|uniref:Effector-binding domain-containing protein n=1 Tax=Raineyella antarctica TaxID=1577474 RepID=A0A1G6GJ61_9ACTN|nr:GyrI-like domain-containing protein [Raineyella antarctica]SDB82047.1 effector-binding domain-containing protein [Raineyella antarctica]